MASTRAQFAQTARTRPIVDRLARVADLPGWSAAARAAIDCAAISREEAWAQGAA